MEQDNKNRIIAWLKSLACAVWAIITIITCAGVWNFCPEKFVVVVSCILLAANGFAIYFAVKGVWGKEEDKLAEINKKLNSKE